MMSSGYIKAIDGMRALAVLAVIAYHLKASLLPGGFSGVDVFFVISGFVIARSLSDGYKPTIAAFIGAFYKRRILRILPALLVCLLVTSAVSSLLIPNFWLSQLNVGTAKWAIFGLSNFYLESVADGYFSDRIPFNPFVHTWSLGVEEQFYCIFPLIYFFHLRARAASRGCRWPVVAMIFLTVLSFFVSVFETQNAQLRAFYLLPSRFWEFAFGVLSCVIVDWKQMRLSAAWTNWTMAVGTALLAIGFVGADESSFPFYWAVVPVLGTTMLLLGIVQPAITGWGRLIESVLTSQPMVFIGKLSYSLYLWHWPVFVLFRWTVGLEGFIHSMAALLATFSLSVMSYYLVEVRLRYAPFIKGTAAWRVVIVGGIATVLCLVCVTRLGRGDISLSVTANQAVWSPFHSAEGYGRSTMHSAVGAGRAIFVIGDSHAEGYMLMVNAAAKALGAEVHFLSNPGCPIVSLMYSRGASDQHCLSAESDIAQRISTDGKPGDVVFLASLRVPRLSNQWGSFDEQVVFQYLESAAAAEMRETALNQSEEFVRVLQAAGMHVVIDAPMPVFRAPLFRCSDWFNRINPVCAPGFEVDRATIDRLRAPTLQSLATLARKTNITIWDPLPALCGGTKCAAVKGDAPLFYDGDHLAAEGNRVLVPSFTDSLNGIWSVARS